MGRIGHRATMAATWRAMRSSVSAVGRRLLQDWQDLPPVPDPDRSARRRWRPFPPTRRRRHSPDVPGGCSAGWSREMPRPRRRRRLRIPATGAGLHEGCAEEMPEGCWRCQRPTSLPATAAEEEGRALSRAKRVAMCYFVEISDDSQEAVAAAPDAGCAHEGTIVRDRRIGGPHHGKGLTELFDVIKIVIKK